VLLPTAIVQQQLRQQPQRLLLHVVIVTPHTTAHLALENVTVIIPLNPEMTPVIVGAILFA
tara:strand:- start:440 stop:622 length:183 start_codon:yes stop_codon:yes gene_type:complete